MVVCFVTVFTVTTNTVSNYPAHARLNPISGEVVPVAFGVAVAKAELLLAVS